MHQSSHARFRRTSSVFFASVVDGCDMERPSVPRPRRKYIRGRLGQVVGKRRPRPSPALFNPEKLIGIHALNHHQGSSYSLFSDTTYDRINPQHELNSPSLKHLDEVICKSVKAVTDLVALDSSYDIRHLCLAVMHAFMQGYPILALRILGCVYTWS